MAATQQRDSPPVNWSEMRTFQLGQILSITSGVLLCDIGGVYEILNYMTGDTLFTHQLPRASREVSPEILRQHPQLGEINTDEVDRDNWQTYLAAWEKRFGKALPLEPMPPRQHVAIDALAELVSMVGADNVIVVDAK